jgi:DNA helicase HerA-like ATPase
MCIVYALTKRPGTPSELLRLNFYEDASNSKQVLNSLIRQAGRTSDYINDFISVDLPDIEIVEAIPNSRINEKIRAIRRLQYYWALLHKAQFSVDEARLRKTIPSASGTSGFNPGFSANLRNAAYSNASSSTPAEPKTLDALVRELEVITRFKRENRNSPLLTTASGNPLFDQDDNAILEMLEPQPGRSGFVILRRFRELHDQSAGNYREEVIKLLDQGKTVILDLGNANEELVSYFSRQLSEAVFYHQMDKFTANNLGNHFIQVYFEEAHNLFAANDTDERTRIYRRFAKEGAKYHIGMVYSTQSPTTINPDLLAQTENFFVAHLASQDDVNRLSRVNIAYESLKDDILQAKTVGYIRMLTRSHRFVVSMQALRFSPPNKGG